MTAYQMALLQAFAACMVAGVSIAFIVYVTGLDRIVRHPLISLETAIAVPMSWLPKPRRKTYRKHYRGRHR